jgi:hypothetical protein
MRRIGAVLSEMWQFWCGWVAVWLWQWQCGSGASKKERKKKSLVIFCILMGQSCGPKYTVPCGTDSMFHTPFEPPFRALSNATRYNHPTTATTPHRHCHSTIRIFCSHCFFFTFPPNCYNSMDSHPYVLILPPFEPPSPALSNATPYSHPTTATCPHCHCHPTSHDNFSKKKTKKLILK